MDRPRLLVVDDDSYTRHALRSLLTDRGWDVALAGTVAEAMGLLRPDLRCVILDLNLPDGRGESVLKTLRATCPKTRVAVCSGMTDPDRLSLVHSYAPEMLLWKPIDVAPIFRLCASAFASAG